MTARNAFDVELDALNLELIRMGGLVEDAIENAVAAFKNQDNALAQSVADGDAKVDDMEKRIEARCLSLIIRQQPVANDLRRISAALKVITDMERIGDNAQDIAQLSMAITGKHIFDVVKHIPKMSECAVKMVHDAVTAFVHHDMELAKQTIAADDVTDSLFCDVKAEISDVLKRGADIHNNTVDFLMIAKYLERIADHAVNICEWAEFSQTGMHKDKQIL
ncbi:MAG: phosphate signaling complex protein PhoU [Oscillospiraceae bacterium]|jgi:phosphate transport system protein|nr:phosphate signaling complex protein PhoU [Oscillospiraceae bacterium]